MPRWPRFAALVLALCRGTTATSILSARQPASDPAEDADEMVMKSVGGQLSHSMRAKQQAQAAFDYEARLDQLGQSIQTEERAAAELEGRARETAALEAELRALKAEKPNSTSMPADSEVACRQKMNTLKKGVNGLNNEIFDLQLKMKDLSVEKNALLNSMKHFETELQHALGVEEPAQPAVSGEPEKKVNKPDAEAEGPAQSQDALDNVELTKIVKTELAKNKKLKDEQMQLSRTDAMIAKIAAQDKKLESVRQTKQRIYAMNGNLTKRFETLTHQLQEAQNATARRVFAQNNRQKLTSEVLELESQVQGLSSERHGQ